jgi:hypothetical protein
MRITIVLAVGGVPGEPMGMGLFVRLPTAVITAIEAYRGGGGGAVVLRVLRERENLDHSRGVIREDDDGAAITTMTVET